jgi:hypothetical protein
MDEGTTGRGLICSINHQEHIQSLSLVGAEEAANTENMHHLIFKNYAIKSMLQKLCPVTLT